MKSIADKLANVSSPITEKSLMLMIFNELGPGYHDIATFITSSRMEYDYAYALLVIYRMTRVCLMQVMHILMDIIPRHSMLNLEVVLGDEDILVASFVILVAEIISLAEEA